MLLREVKNERFLGCWNCTDILQTPERLIGSQGVFTTFMTQAVMAKVGPLSVATLMLWAFSPLGCQAYLRILRTEYNNINSTTEFAYLNMTQQLSGFQAAYSPSDSQYAINALYTGCLIGTESTKNGTEDSWGNVKIPMIETLDAYMASDGWMSVPRGVGAVTYNSLLGIPVSGLPIDKYSSFNLEAYYHHLQYPSINVMNAIGDWLTPLNIPYSSQHNTSTIWTHSGHNSFCLGTYANETNDRFYGNDSSPTELVLLSRSGLDLMTNNYTNITVVNCSMTPTFVESNVQCNGINCRVDRMRNPTAPKPSEVIPLIQGLSQLFNLYSTGLAKSTAVTDLYSTPTEHYIFGDTSFPFAHGMKLVSL